MRGRFLAVAALILTLAALSLVPVVTGQQQPGTATLNIKVPPDAKLYFDNAITSQTGTMRTFVTPPLKAGSKFVYAIKVDVIRGGQTLSETKHVDFQAGQTVDVDFTAIGQPQQAQGAAGEADPGDAPWPRKVESGGDTITIYQPQVEKWERNLLTARAAVAVTTKASPVQAFGVVWFTARTDVDREDSIVTLDDFKITKLNFPSAPDKGDSFLGAIKSQLPAGSKTVSLVRLEANLAVTQAESKVRAVPLKNEPPRVIYTTKPAVLVLVDDQPVLRDVSGSKLRRVINTRALLVQDTDSGLYYMHFVDGWLEAKAIDGDWSPAPNPPASLEALKKSLGKSPDVDLLDDPAPDLKEEMEKGIHPMIYVSTVPAELLEFEGEPDLAPIDGTQLLYVKNSANQVVLDTATADYYALMSGRWFKSKSLDKGPWDFVAADKLPADFAKIPDNHPVGDVLASVAGTPQAKEAAIANEVPQTATVKRSDAKLTTMYDGDPQFEPIEQTDLRYAVNTPTPVIQVTPQSYYAVENGVWFTATGAVGPWAVADAVPAAIYGIPPSSPIYYVTNCQVYGSTPDVVYVGYTPGYFGTCLSPWGTVVYGTGWNYRPWVGRYWFGRSWTYGCDVSFRWNTAGGWSFGFGAGIGRPWWGPVGWNAAYGGAWRAGWERGYGGRYANVHASNIHVNNFNVYNRWPTNSVVNRRVGAVGAVSRTNVVAGRGLNNVYAGVDGGVYKKTAVGWNQHVTAGAWNPAMVAAPALTHLNTQVGARNIGAIHTQNFRAAGGFAGAGGVRVGGATGYRGGAVGFRRR
jgi:uncharacterized protein (TIGR03000 family)